MAARRAACCPLAPPAAPVLAGQGSCAGCCWSPARPVASPGPVPLRPAQSPAGAPAQPTPPSAAPAPGSGGWLARAGPGTRPAHPHNLAHLGRVPLSRLPVWPQGWMRSAGPGKCPAQPPFTSGNPLRARCACPPTGWGLTVGRGTPAHTASNAPQPVSRQSRHLCWAEHAVATLCSTTHGLHGPGSCSLLCGKLTASPSQLLLMQVICTSQNPSHRPS